MDSIVVIDPFDPWWALLVYPAAFVVLVLAGAFLTIAFVRKVRAPGAGIHALMIAIVVVTLGVSLSYHFSVREPRVRAYVQRNPQSRAVREAAIAEVRNELAASGAAVLMTVISLLYSRSLPRTTPS